jgi:DNA-binding NarL/FixJ family response regulator
MTLSPRERDVLSALASGLGQKAAALKLGMSPYTLKDRITSARHKLGATTTLQAALIAQQRGIL